jgi:glycosyltransferase involved in cell wall biosynthesis
MESFGMVVAEALAHGVPVIASRNTPWREMESKGCGLWVDNSPESLASSVNAIRHLNLEEMGMKGREWMRESYCWNSIAKRTMTLYRDLHEDLQSEG